MKRVVKADTSSADVFVYGWNVEIPKDVTEVRIPNNLRAILGYAFRDCTELTHVEIPYGVTEIGNYAFDNCSSLKSITIPDSVKEIGVGAFCGCTSLTEIKLPSKLRMLDAFMFYGCTSLESITIPDSVTIIDNHVFGGCTNLKNVTIPDRVREIGHEAFGGCENLTDLTVPDSVTKFGDEPFKGCINLNNLVLPEKFKSKKSELFVASEADEIVDNANVDTELSENKVRAAISDRFNFINTRLKQHGFSKTKFKLLSVDIDEDNIDDEQQGYSFTAKDSNGVEFEGYVEFICDDDGVWTDSDKIYDQTDLKDELFYAYAEAAGLSI